MRHFHTLADGRASAPAPTSVPPSATVLKGAPIASAGCGHLVASTTGASWTRNDGPAPARAPPTDARAAAPVVDRVPYVPASAVSARTHFISQPRPATGPSAAAGALTGPPQPGVFCPPALFYCPEYERAKKPAAEVAAVAANRLSRSSTVGGSPHRMEANAAGVSTHSGRNEAWTDHYSDWASTSASALADVGDALSLRASDPLGASRQSAGGRLSDTRGSAQSVDDVKEVCVWQFLQETTVDRLQGLMLKVGAMQRSHPRGQFTPATQAQLSALLQHAANVDRLAEDFDRLADSLMAA